VEQDRAFAYQGFCEIIQEYFRHKDNGSSPAPDFSDLAADLLALFPMLGEIGDIRSAATGESKLGGGASAGPENKTQIFELLARTLTRLAGGKPLVLVLEDLHGAEVTIEALPYIATRLGPTPTLILGSYRTTEVDDRHPLTRVLDGFRGDRRFSLVTLGPFTPSDHRTFLETLVGASELSDSLVKRLFDAAKGNPFFTKELVRSLLDAGGISRDDTGQWSLSGEAEISADALPATIQQAVEKRIRRLPEDLRELLATASVIGKTFDSRDLEALAKDTDVDDAIDRLVQQGLVEEERESRGELLSFSSGVVRDVLYAGLSPRKRRSLHRRCAEILEGRHGGRIDRVLPQLVHHFYQGDVADKAVEYGLRLARASLEAYSAEEAARSAKTALDFLDEEWEGDRSLEGEARMLLARANRLAGDIEGALQEAAAAARIFEQQSQAARAVGVLLLAAETAWQARRSEEAGTWTEKGLAAARAAGDTESLRQLLSLAATLANLRGEHAKANEFLEEAARLAPEAKEAARPEAIAPGGRLVVALPNPVRSLEPTGIEINEEFEVCSNVYETLLATDSRGNLEPLLCEKWEPSEGGRTFVLTLRRGIRFSDGSPATATDIKTSVETCVRAARDVPPAFTAIRGSAEHRSGASPAIDGIMVRDDRTLEVRLLEPLPVYPALLTAATTGIVRPVRERGDDRPRLLGTGPFQLASVEPERIVLERNTHYWKGDPPLLEAVEFRTGLSATAIARGFRAGEIDLARDLLPQDLEEILRDPRFRRGFVETPTKNSYFVTFNCRTGEAAGKEAIRRALAGVVRTNDLVWRTLGRFAQPAVGLIPPGMLGHDAGRRAQALTLDEAREVLEKAGIARPLRLKASVHPLLRDRYSSLLDALFSLWSELGAEISIETADMATFLGTFEDAGGLDLLLGRWNIDYDDPDNFTHTLFHSKTGTWRNWFSSPVADKILEEARAESRPAVREALYRKFEGLLLEAAAIVPLFHDIDHRVAGPKVRGITLRNRFPTVNYSELGRVEPREPEAEARRGSGGTIHAPMAGVVSTLDPPYGIAVEYSEVFPCIYESLTRDAGGARIVPALAAEFKAEENGRRYRFRLRDDVRFHDGRRLGARDVRHSFERLLLSSSENRWFFNSIRGAAALVEGKGQDLEGFRIHSASEFTIELTEPLAFFPALLAFDAAAIVPEGADPSVGLEACVGTGPFRVVSFEPGRRLELERNRSYWRKGFPRSERLVFSFDVPPGEILSGFRASRFSLASDLFPADAEALRREPEFASRYRDSPRLTTYFVAFNARSGPLRDRALRRRLVEAVDVAKTVRQTLGRLALPAAGLIPPGLLGHDPRTVSRAEAARPAAPAPISPPLELTAAVHPVFFGGYSAFARELTGAFARLGVKVRPVNQTIDEYLQITVNPTVDLIVGRWNADYPDADTFAGILFSKGFIGQLYASAEIDRLVERGRAETTPSARHEIYRDVEDTIVREALLLPLFHEQAYRFARPEVEGLTLSSTRGHVLYEELFVRV
jgi:peptide/nickel transport system substrate-binding protein/oligopeptide transport system substrate-binding protein